MGAAYLADFCISEGRETFVPFLFCNYAPFFYHCQHLFTQRVKKVYFLSFYVFVQAFCPPDDLV